VCLVCFCTHIFPFCSNATSGSPYFFDSALLQNVEYTARQSTNEPFFEYILDQSERLVIDGVVVEENGTSIPQDEIQPLIDDLKIPSIQRLTLDDVGLFLWGFPNVPFDFADNTSSCVAVDPQNDFRWFRTTCDQNFYLACQVLFVFIFYSQKEEEEEERNSKL